jgi:lysocardiolipin and lysophospholipid acyltransferase
MHWRRFAVSSIPVDDSDAFAAWLDERWREKDRLIQYYVETGRFPTDGASTSAVPNGSGVKLIKEEACIETEVRPSNPLELLLIYLPLAALLLVINVVLKFIRMVRTTVGL